MRQKLFKKYVKEILSEISVRGTRLEAWAFQWKVLNASDEESEGVCISCSFERPDADTGEYGTGWGRKWYIEAPKGDTVNKAAVFFTAQMTIRQILEHEMLESMQYRGVIVVDPHKPFEKILEGSRSPQRVD